MLVHSGQGRPKNAKRQGSLKSQKSGKTKIAKEKFMKIDVSAIEGYESMTAEEKLNALLNYDVSDTEVAKLRKQISDKNAEISDWKKKHNALLDEDQRKQVEIEDTINALREQNALLLKGQTINSYTAKLLAKGFDPNEAAKSAELLADGKIDEFLENNLGTYRTSIEKSVKTQLIKDNQSPGGVGGNELPMTKEQYDKLPMHEKMKFMAEHREDYEKMKETNHG